MNYAIVEASGRQFWVESGRFYDFNNLNLNPGDKIALTRVLLVNENGNVSVGKPCLKEAKVEATILGHIRSKKITVYKMRPKKKTRKKQGHRNDLTRVLIDKITLGGKSI
jgi:large subunit ribosomal protein L21